MGIMWCDIRLEGHTVICLRSNPFFNFFNDAWLGLGLMHADADYDDDLVISNGY